MPEDRAHIARWDPARVLAECEAKRRIVELHGCYHSCRSSDYAGDCPTMDLVALPYASHPEYREEWRATEA
jgi:hypothetical protein